MLKDSIKKHFSFIVTSSLAYLYFIELNLTDHYSYVTMHFDETIIFNQLKNTYHSENFKELLYNLFHQGDFQYGRIITYIPAVILYPFFSFFGDVNLFVLNRVLFMSLHFFAIILLIQVFIKDKLKKILALIFIMSLDSTLYYAHVPKPEPFLLFFISLYFWFYQYREKFGLFFWGLNVGTKISSIPAAIGITFLTLYKKEKKKTLHLILLFLSGFFIANPALLTFFPSIWSSYIADTFLNTGFIVDNKDIYFLDWITRFFKDYFGYSSIYLFLIIGLIFSKLINAIKSKKYLELKQNKKELLLISLCFIIPILLFVNRVWLFYLHIGVILLTIFTLSLKFDLAPKRKNFILILSFLLLGSETIKAFNFSFELRNRDTLAPGYYKLKEWHSISDYLKQNMKHNESVCFYYKAPYEPRELKFNFIKEFTPGGLYTDGCDFFVFGKKVLTNNFYTYPLLNEKIMSFKNHLQNLTHSNCKTNCLIKTSFNPNSEYVIYKKR